MHPPEKFKVQFSISEKFKIDDENSTVQAKRAEKVQFIEENARTEVNFTSIALNCGKASAPGSG
jgi:hypothetical protein